MQKERKRSSRGSGERITAGKQDQVTEYVFFINDEETVIDQPKKKKGATEGEGNESIKFFLPQSEPPED